MAGIVGFSYSWPIAVAVAFVMFIVVLSYRQNVHAYPSGGGDYEVATVNFGPNAGLTVASALLVDYVLTVAVSICAGTRAITSIPAFASWQDKPVPICLVLIGFVTLLNLRGLKESGRIFAIPTYVYICLLYTSPSPRDRTRSRMPSSA